jgi:nitrate reductase alpha subunit
VSQRAFQKLGEHTGIDFSPLTKNLGNKKMSLEDITLQPRRIHTSPCWSGIIEEGRPYSAFTINTEYRLPWHTLTGRQHFYLDHEWYIEAGEAFGIYKPNLAEASLNELDENCEGLKLNYHTPHGKWNMHTTFFDNLRMLTLSRGGQVVWLSNRDAAEHGIEDNDWVEVHNKNGTVVCRTVVTSKMPQGTCYIHHATERTINVPISERTGNRAGNHNSLTRVRLKPLCMVGGYGQFSYYFNYWGPTGVNRDSYVIVKKLDRVRF